MSLSEAQQLLEQHEIDPTASVNQVLEEIEQLGQDLVEALQRQAENPTSSTSLEQ